MSIGLRLVDFSGPLTDCSLLVAVFRNPIVSGRAIWGKRHHHFGMFSRRNYAPSCRTTTIYMKYLSLFKETLLSCDYSLPSPNASTLLTVLAMWYLCNQICDNFKVITCLPSWSLWQIIEANICIFTTINLAAKNPILNTSESFIRKSLHFKFNRR